MPISVVIPSYRNPAYLDLCLQTAFENQDNSDNQIIVVLDGFAEESAHVIEKYPGLNVMELPENKGQTYAHNHGVIAAEHEWVILLNDDNVFSKHFDSLLLRFMKDNHVISPNQVEPVPSIFKSFHIQDFGCNPETFERIRFEEYANTIAVDFFNSPNTNDGSTWPLFIQKKNYMMLGGIDPYFPSPSVADWDFFRRCELAGLVLQRAPYPLFYHFAGASTRKKDTTSTSIGEQQSMEYFKYKWGFYPQRDSNNLIIQPNA